ncbi:maltokinase N-terminal cap-like domain-containing protein [Tessaracoccus flavescens]|uniref:Maltokinase N-terminal cap domain-containing protein n=1 Tax=Tessaracoccus flavescens TaxID=399497 RepID=A0A1Q2D1E9_9ACTN|nr:hypothetical protein [Tessaracoccus flavescens]AQP52198.1 hypothetical protein BW733_16585 [Tessaracoccus flavescens]
MAILHQATLSPTKLTIVTDYLDMLGWGAGPVQQVGSYRYDDPEGEVGVEGILATRGSDTFHLPFTYRGEPLKDAEPYLITTMEHSVLGKRWVYDATHDPVAIGCYLRALAGEQDQATLNVYDAAEQLVEVREPTVVVKAERRGPVAPDDLTLIRRLEEGVPVNPEAPALLAEWEGGNSAYIAFG